MNSSSRTSSFAAAAPGSRAGWLSATQAAQYMSIAPRTLLKWARNGKVRGHQLSGTQRVTWRFLIEDLDNVMLDQPSVALTRRVQ